MNIQDVHFLPLCVLIASAILLAFVIVLHAKSRRNFLQVQGNYNRAMAADKKLNESLQESYNRQRMELLIKAKAVDTIDQFHQFVKVLCHFQNTYTEEHGWLTTAEDIKPIIAALEEREPFIFGQGVVAKRQQQHLPNIIAQHFSPLNVEPCL